MHETLQSDYKTTIAEFRAFIDDRPDDEKWELIDGEIVLNPTANNRHQIIAHNIQYELEAIRRRIEASWRVHAGIGTRHPQDQHNEPIPDVMVVPRSNDIFNWTFDVPVAFEVLSPFSRRRDMVHLLYEPRASHALHRLGAGPGRGHCFRTSRKVQSPRAERRERKA